MDGLFITFEGTEGSGKSTQAKRLQERLGALGREVVSVREPGGTPLGEEIRSLLKHHPAGRGMRPEAELLLINAARAQLVREVILPALDRGAIVLCDRFFDSTVAYQGYARGLSLTDVRKIIDFAVGGAMPNLTLLLKLPAGASRQRIASRDAGAPPVADHFEEADQAFFDRVEAGYNAIEGGGGTRVRVIDASDSIEVVEAEIWRWVEQMLLTPMAPGEREFKSIGEYRNQGPG